MSNRGYVKECEFTYLGFDAFIVLLPTGYRCIGIVVPDTNPCWHADSKEFEHIKNSFHNELISVVGRTDPAETQRLLIFDICSELYQYPDIGALADFYCMDVNTYNQILSTLDATVRAFQKEAEDYKVLTLEYAIGVTREIIDYLFSVSADVKFYTQTIGDFYIA